MPEMKIDAVTAAHIDTPAQAKARRFLESHGYKVTHFQKAPGEDAEALPVFEKGGDTYVMGTDGKRVNTEEAPPAFAAA